LSSDLDEIAAPRSAGAPITLAGTPLSSSAVLALGTVLGLAGLASLFALLIQLAPQSGEPTAVPAPQPQVVTPTAVVTTPRSAALQAPVPSPKRQRVEGPWRIGSPGPGQRKISGEIGQEPFLRALQTAGIPRDQAYRIHTALKSEKNLDRCRPKDQFVALVEGNEKRVVAFEYIAGKEEVYQARQQSDGLLKGGPLDLQVKRERVQGSILITSGSFSEAVVAAGLEPSLGEVVNRALEGHTSVAQFQRGDRLRVLAQEVTVLGEFSRYAGIEALEYLPVNGKPLRIYYYSQRKKYYDAQGRAPGEGGWRRPVKGAPITSRYNPNRLHPILKKRMPHTGTDFGAPTGTPVYAASYGTLTKLGVYGPNGNFIAIQHEHGYETGYSHLSRFEPGLKVGDKVKRAQVIGYVGSTGRSTGPHLHFSAKKNGAFIDPESLNMDALTVLPPEDRAGFAKVRAQYESLLEAVPLPPALNEPAPPAPAETHLDLGMEELPDGVEPEAMATTALAPSPVPPPAQQAAALPAPMAAPTLVPAPAAQPATRPAGASLYLSDQELLQSQPAFDEGEVEQ
jgi:hypothetical protein